MAVTTQTITMTTGATAGPQTFRLNPRDALLSFSTASVAASARLQLSVDNGATWEPGFLLTTALTTTTAVIVGIAPGAIPVGVMSAPCLFRLNSSVASNYTMKIITAN